MEKIDKNKNDNMIVYFYVGVVTTAFIFGLVYLAWIRPYF